MTHTTARKSKGTKQTFRVGQAHTPHPPPPPPPARPTPRASKFPSIARGRQVGALCRRRPAGLVGRRDEMASPHCSWGCVCSWNGKMKRHFLISNPHFLSDLPARPSPFSPPHSTSAQPHPPPILKPQPLCAGVWFTHSLTLMEQLWSGVRALILITLPHIQSPEILLWLLSLFLSACLRGDTHLAPPGKAGRGTITALLTLPLITARRLQGRATQE